MKKGTISMLAFLLMGIVAVGCSQINAKNLPGDPLGLFTTALQTGFVNADNNFHLAVTNGDLQADDPIIPCFDALVGPQPSPTQQPYNANGLVEAASVLYIRANSIQGKQNVLNTSCQAIIGKFTIDMFKNAPINPARPLVGG